MIKQPLAGIQQSRVNAKRMTFSYRFEKPIFNTLYCTTETARENLIHVDLYIVMCIK